MWDRYFVCSCMYEIQIFCCGFNNWQISFIFVEATNVTGIEVIYLNSSIGVPIRVYNIFVWFTFAAERYKSLSNSSFDGPDIRLGNKVKNQFRPNLHWDDWILMNRGSFSPTLWHKAQVHRILAQKLSFGFSNRFAPNSVCSNKTIVKTHLWNHIL